MRQRYLPLAGTHFYFSCREGERAIKQDERIVVSRNLIPRKVTYTTLRYDTIRQYYKKEYDRSTHRSVSTKDASLPKEGEEKCLSRAILQDGDELGRSSEGMSFK